MAALLATVHAVLSAAALAGTPVAASAPAGRDALPRVVEVPARPAFVTPPNGTEAAARTGQTLLPASLLRTQTPGRLQIRLADGRELRLGGDALLRLGRTELELKRGQIIGWVTPGRKGGAPLRIRTRVGVASIQGTTVFIEDTPTSLKVFSWEGRVNVDTTDGRRFTLTSGEEVVFEGRDWIPPRRLSRAEAVRRRRDSLLLNGFTSSMETLPLIERELGLPP